MRSTSFVTYLFCVSNVASFLVTSFAVLVAHSKLATTRRRSSGRRGVTKASSASDTQQNNRRRQQECCNCLLGNPPSNSPTSPIDHHQQPVSTSSWAFEETFDGDPSSPSQDLLPREMEYVVTHRTHPGKQFSNDYIPYLADHDNFCAGPDPDVFPLPQHEVKTVQDSTGSRPDKSFYICKNHMMSSMGGVDPYSISAFWPRQELSFANGGVVEFDVNINDGHTVRSWWEIMIVPRDQLRVAAGPVDSPISETYPLDRIVFDFRRNVRTIKVGTETLAPSGWLANESQRGPWDYSWWHDRHPNDPALSDHRIRRKMRISLQNSQIIWAIETEDGTMDEFRVDIPGGLPFSQGLVVFKTHAYNPTKDANYNVYTFHWDNIRFNGPIVGVYEVFEASDVVYLQRDGNREIGDTVTVTIDLPEETPLNNPILFGQIHHPMIGQVLLSINGQEFTAVNPYEYGEPTEIFGPSRDNCLSLDWKSFRVELDVHQLNSGSNYFEWMVGPRPNCAMDTDWDGFSVKFLQIQLDL